VSPRPRGHPDHPEAGQASAEFVAILPALVVCALIAAHGVAAGWAVWSAASAARAGARAEHVGGDGADAARRALPGALRRGARVESDEAIEVTVRAPILLPGGSGPALTVSSQLDPADG
jgi:hypothetical protein